MTPEQAAKVVEDHAGERVLVKTSYGSDLEGVLVRSTDRALVVDTEEPGQRGVFLQQVTSVEPVEVTETCHDCDDEEPCDECSGQPEFHAILTVRSAVELRDYSDRTRQRLAEEEKALPDGSFPIRNKADLRRAVQALGRASDQAKARAHIVRRAKDLEATDLLPSSWRESTAEAAAARVVQMERAVTSLAPRVFAD